MVDYELLNDARLAAPKLLGAKLIHRHGDAAPVGGIIVEAESYVADDPASHAFGGETIRNSALFESAGTVYVYRSYGLHWCVNIVTGRAGYGEGVLIRALEPTVGIDDMRRRRNKTDVHELTNGPGKLTQALGITLDCGHTLLGKGCLQLELPEVAPPVTSTARIGISKSVDELERWIVKDSRFVSRR